MSEGIPTVCDTLRFMGAISTSQEPQLPRRELLWLKEGQKCHWCGKPTRLNPTNPDGTPNWNAWDTATKDHILPRWRGGSDDESNLTSACRLCNNRRSHEDNCGLPDGSLLGKFDPDNGLKPKRIKAKASPARVVLTGDEKKAIVNGRPVIMTAENVLREQRDQAHRELGKLRTENLQLKSQMENYRQKLKTMTFRKLLFIKLIHWLRHEK